MRTHLPLLLCLASLAAPAAEKPLDPHDPAALVARARQALREDDFRTACVLLSRAGQLAPHDARVELAWGDFEARTNGLPISEEPAPGADAAAASREPVAPEPPAPWPAK
jgi:hypothetical protein